ncbi:MAG: hypothetical protein NZ914_13600 [Gemmatales bacterium]|nr:hypothetical protein [Gemmatales bacterium]
MWVRTLVRRGTKQLRIRQWTWSLASLAVAFVLSHGASLRSESAPPQSWFT